MKKYLIVLLAMALLASPVFAQGAAEEAAKKTELTVFAAASLTETITEIADLYMAANPDISVVCNFDSSGTLKTQIQEGAVCDVFISAGQKQMNQLDITASSSVNTDGLDFVLQGSRVDLLENKVTLAVADGNSRIKSFDQLAQLLKDHDVFLAIGNSDVPVGQYTIEIFAYYGIDEQDAAYAGCLTYGSNVKEVTTQVSMGSVECGIIYGTDAFSAGLTVVDEATSEMCSRVVYPAAVMKNSEHAAEAQAFLDYLSTDEAAAIFRHVGFTPLQD